MEDAKIPFSERAILFFKQNLATLIIVLISIIYIFSGLASISESGKTIPEIIAGSIINLVIGLSIKSLLRENGIRDGRKDHRYIATLKTYGEKLENNTSNIPSLDEYCDYRNEKKLKQKQTIFLRKYGLSYNEFIEHKYDETHPKIVDKCRNLKYDEINTLIMLNAVNIVDSEENLLKKNIKFFKTSSALKNTFISLLCAFLFAYYSLEKGEFNLMGMLWAALQIVLHLTLGTLEYFSAASFITNDLRSKLILIISCFDEFETMLKDGYFKKGVKCINEQQDYGNYGNSNSNNTSSIDKECNIDLSTTKQCYQ